MRVYVVTHPESIRGVYDNWPACQAAVSGVPGARHQAVSNRAEADRVLRGVPLSLPHGTYAFLDGNHRGGIGIVFVRQLRNERTIREVSTTVDQVFGDSAIPDLSSPESIRQALGRIRNILAELGALYEALRRIAPKTALKVVHDYEGIEAWMRGRWRTKDSLVRAIVSTCRQLVEEKQLHIEFRHQRGHASTFLSKNDFAHYNAKADQLASEARIPATESFHTERGAAPAGRAAAARKGRKEETPGLGVRRPSRKPARR